MHIHPWLGGLDCAHILLQVERLKPAYLAHRRAQGIYTDPFERARRQEQLQHQQQRPAPSAAAQQHGALPAAAAGALPALPAPPSGTMACMLPKLAAVSTDA